MKTLGNGLKKMRVLTAFKREFKRDHKDSKYFNPTFVANYLASDHNRLAGAFSWGSTTQGHPFWSNIDRKLEDYFNTEI